MIFREKSSYFGVLVVMRNLLIPHERQGSENCDVRDISLPMSFTRRRASAGDAVEELNAIKYRGVSVTLLVVEIKLTTDFAIVASHDFWSELTDSKNLTGCSKFYSLFFVKVKYFLWLPFLINYIYLYVN